MTKTFGSGSDAVTALRDVELDVAAGEFVCLIGASGCGKSTILNLVAGLDNPTGGEVLVDGRTAMMFQESALFPWLTIAKNVELPMRLAGVSRAERKERAAELIRTVHLDGFGDKRPHQLSGGMRQRAALARAFAQEADILLMDEPFGALDAMTRDVLHEELDALVRDRRLTVLFVTHNVREAARLADRIVIMSPRPGRVTAEIAVDIERPRRIDSTGREHARRPRSPTDCARRFWSMLELDDKIASMAPELSPDEALAVDSQLDDRSLVPVNRPSGRHRARAIWLAVWPKVAAVAIALGIWQLVVLSGWRPEYVLPAPATVFDRLGELIADGTVFDALLVTGERALVGYGAALVIGIVLGSLVASSKIVRSAVGSMITGLQTMPSIAWFPLAILLFQLSEQAITFVVVLGAAPSIANGLITGVDHAPPTAAAGRHDDGRQPVAAPPPRDAAGRHAVVRRRAEAGLGLRLAQPDGRRADRDPRPVRRIPAAAVPQPRRRRRADRDDDRDPGGRHPHRHARVRHARPHRAAPSRPH